MSHTRLRMTILYSEDGDSKDYFGEPARQPRESPSRRRFRVSMGKTVRTKRRNEVDRWDLERFVQLTTSNEILGRYKRHLALWPAGGPESGVRSNRSFLAAQRLPICRSAKSRQSQSPTKLSLVRIAT